MKNNPRLKNLQLLSKALIAVSDGMNNLTVEDEAEMRAKFGCVPDQQRLEALSDWLNERVANAPGNNPGHTSVRLRMVCVIPLAKDDVNVEVG